MATQTADHVFVFTAIDRAYGLIDGSTAWTDCLDALIATAGIEASKLHLYECARGRSHVVEASGMRFERGHTDQNLDIDEALWRSTPGQIWLPSGADIRERHPSALGVYGYSVLDRDSSHILFLEFLCRASETRRPDSIKQLLETVLPHVHRACRLHRSVTGDDLVAFTAPELAQLPTSAGMPIELRLRRRFRLSKAEARVATLLSDGLAPRAIADRLNVSIHTVRSQLQAIFSKTDTSRQAELTSLILRETEIPRTICQTNTVGLTQGESPSCR